MVMRRYYSYPYKAEPLHFPIEPIARKFVTVAIILCLILVFFNLGAGVALDPKRMAESEMEKIAKDYYENYYYDEFISHVPDNEVNIAFATYTDYGFPRVYLRELLLFDEGRHAASRPFFEGNYVCNTNQTSIQIVPYAPFGKTDYRINYFYDCDYNYQKR